ncbi:MAG: hypothetical protein V4757_02040 [Pseudomonadota bacterium]
MVNPIVPSIGSATRNVTNFEDHTRSLFKVLSLHSEFIEGLSICEKLTKASKSSASIKQHVKHHILEHWSKTGYPRARASSLANDMADAVYTVYGDKRPGRMTDDKQMLCLKLSNKLQLENEFSTKVIEARTSGGKARQDRYSASKIEVIRLLTMWAPPGGWQDPMKAFSEIRPELLKFIEQDRALVIGDRLARTVTDWMKSDRLVKGAFIGAGRKSRWQ